MRLVQFTDRLLVVIDHPWQWKNIFLFGSAEITPRLFKLEFPQSSLEISIAAEGCDLHLYLS